MNSRAAGETHAKDGGRELIGRSILDCHPERARALFEELLKTGALNVYTDREERREEAHLPAPWYEGGEYRGRGRALLADPFRGPACVPGLTDGPSDDAN